MEKVLTQAEIDALVRAAGGRKEPPLGINGQGQVEPWDPQEGGRLQKEQLHAIGQLHESFARNLSHSLGAYLRDKFEVTTVSVEQLPYREFLARMPEMTYYGSFHLQPAGSSGILQLDLSLAFPIVDLLLGGQGAAELPSREVSEIEELILEGVGRIICRELGAVWRPLGLSAEFGQHQAGAQRLRIMPAQEKTLTVSFEVTMADARGLLNLAFPAVVSSALLRKLSSELVYHRPREAAVHQDGIKRQLLDSPVELVLGTPWLPVKVKSLLEIRPGNVLLLRRRIDETVTLRLGGRDSWQARPVQSGSGMRAAHLLERIIQPDAKEI